MLTPQWQNDFCSKTIWGVPSVLLYTAYHKEKESLKRQDFDTFKYDFKVAFSEENVTS